MKERPIIFSGELVQAILVGSKAMTRRVVKVQPPSEATGAGVIFSGTDSHGLWSWTNGDPRDIESVGIVGEDFRCPYGVEGDRLWVREAWTSGYRDGCFGTIFRADGSFLQGKRQHPKGPHFHAKELGSHVRWRPSIHMPRWAARIVLEIESVRVERLKSITVEDIVREGVVFPPQFVGVGIDGSPIEHEHCDKDPWWFFQRLWDGINSRRAPWDSNPWVWCLGFRRVTL